METEFYKKKFTSPDELPQSLKNLEFEDCTFSNIDFKSFQFSHARFIDCSFNYCDLSNVKLTNCRFLSPKFENSKLIGIDWIQVDDLINPNFDTCMMSFSNFSGLKLKKTIFKNCILTDADFLQADFSESLFSGSDLLNARFEETNIMKANFIGALNYQINPVTNKVKGARFSLAEVVGLLTGFDIKIE